MFNLREFQTESQYNEVKDNMPIPNVVHIVSPDTVLFNPKTTRYFWYNGLTSGITKCEKFLMVYDNSQGQDNAYYCSAHFTFYLKDGTSHNLDIDLAYENPTSRRMRVSIPNSGSLGFTKDDLTYWQYNMATYNNNTKWFTINLQNVLKWLRNQYYINWYGEIDYIKFTHQDQNVVSSHWKLLAADIDENIQFLNNVQNLLIEADITDTTVFPEDNNMPVR